MFKIALVIFREFLEMAILLGIILAATKNVRGRGVYIATGAMCGVFCAAVLAFFTKQLAMAFDSIGDEVFDSVVILFTVFVIGWTAVWMQGYTLYIKQEVDSIATQIESGNTHKVLLTLMVAGTIFREASEIVLFIYSIITSSSVSSVDCLSGFLIGAVGGLSFGVALYFGLLKFAGKYVFKICSILLIFIAAGLAAQAAGILTSVGVLTNLTCSAWDSSWLISDGSILGRILKILIGYEAKPNMMQIAFYCATLTVLCACSMFQSKRLKAKSR